MAETYGLRLYAFHHPTRPPEYVWARDEVGADSHHTLYLSWAGRLADRHVVAREELRDHDLAPRKQWPHVEANTDTLRLADRLLSDRRAALLEVLVAWRNGELSEGQACRLCGTDPVTVRSMALDAEANALARWRRLRSCAPPSPGSAGSNCPAPSSSGDPSGSGTTP